MFAEDVKVESFDFAHDVLVIEEELCNVAEVLSVDLLLFGIKFEY